MKLWDIVKTVGATALNVALPGAGTAVIGLVNEFLPDGAKLPQTATGHEVENALQALPPADRAKLMERQFEVDITQIREAHSTVRSMLESDVKNPHSTRPFIALGAFWVVAFAVVTTISVWATGVVTGDSEMVETVVNGWRFILAVIGPLVSLLWAYFGILKTEHKNRLHAAGGSPAGGLVGALAGLFKRG